MHLRLFDFHRRAKQRVYPHAKAGLFYIRVEKTIQTAIQTFPVDERLLVHVFLNRFVHIDLSSGLHTCFALATLGGSGAVVVAQTQRFKILH